MSTMPTPRDGAPVVVVAVDGHAMTWIGPPPGVPGEGEIAGDGSVESRALVTEAKRLWTDPIKVGHPSWRRAFVTTASDPVGVIATLLHLGHGRGVILQAPEDAVADIFQPAPQFG